jgi:uncharacterized protein YdeI (YjbR/CyaY-like superfamily)
MGKRDPRVDAYIKEAEPFARPILEEIRATVHAACPEVEETIKWRFPHFMHKGMLCGMAAFTQHAALGFWKGSLIVDGAKDGDGMGQFGRLTKRSDLPPRRVLAGYVKKAAQLNEEGVKVPRAAKRAAPQAIAMPPDLSAAFKKNRKALVGYEAMSPSHRREYLEWITEAKAEATRARRVAQAIEWMAEGKSRNWKYERT